MITPILKALNAHHVYMDRGGSEILWNASLLLAGLEIYALPRGDGADKSTTLLKCLGFLDPSSGECDILGTPKTNQEFGVHSQIGTGNL